ncbi:tetratricopeptide repeat protein [Sphingomonas sp. So64.6b]|uniref:tetratricopeptide repeat protein n=1 Tax=Sphingomonas sp. So64.6b TaxID=2997354 RepID=UPI0015FF78B8|nr:tetratricopeptide repeat protein [Sphingomonas sp. So64.6b]QNA84673.1 tetratricopeptide repeat protein [Sphingomonas sp. So64.6b]
MAVPPNTDEAFLREVDEELRRDQLASYWTRYGRWLIVVIIVGLAAFGGFLYWKHHSAEVAGKQGEQLQALVDNAGTKPADPKVLQELATSNVDGYQAIARFAQADALLDKRDLKGSAAKFGEIAADASLAQPFRDLALIRQTSAEYDTLKPDVIVNRLRPLAVKGNPWFGSAGELVAAAYLRMNRPDLAGPLFGQIAREETVPATLRQRAVQMAGVLGIDAVDTPEEKKAP